MNTTIAKILKTHTDSDNSTDYTPVFVNQSARDITGNDTGVGYYTDTFFGIHNPSGSAITVTVKTAAQGIDGSGVTVRINAGETFYSIISKITVGAGVTVALLAIPSTFSR
jgi:hypothetical protein